LERWWNSVPRLAYQSNDSTKTSTANQDDLERPTSSEIKTTYEEILYPTEKILWVRSWGEEGRGEMSEKQSHLYSDRTPSISFRSGETVYRREAIKREAKTERGVKEMSTQWELPRHKPT